MFYVLLVLLNMLQPRIMLQKNETICSYHVTYMFQSESRLYSCLNVK